ncbi:MAG: heme ABC exporter ATP-binding protein CcmA [Chloroflexota bacterium]
MSMLHSGSGLALDLRGVAKLYGRTAALKATTLQLPVGETLALLGPNGSGKTTLLKILAGAITPTLGDGTIFGCNLVRERVQLRALVGLLAAETYLYDDLSAEENLRFIVTMAGMRPNDDAITSVLTEVNLHRHAKERVRGFSSGMKRRLALGRLLLLRPRLLLLDEPYNSLDAAAADLVDSIIVQHSAEGGAVVLATHDADRALGLADLVVALEQGAVRYRGPAADFRRDYVQPLV